MGMNINHINHTMPVLSGESRTITEKTAEDSKRAFMASEQNKQQEIEVDRGKVASAVEKINEFNDPKRTNLKFVFHEDLHEYYVTVVNPQTDEVIREIPPKKMLDMFASMMEYMGILVDKKI